MASVLLAGAVTAQAGPWFRHDVTRTFDSPYTVSVGDLDGDGDPDLLSASRDDDEVSWFQNPSDDAGTWTELPIAAGVDDPFSVCAADVDGDGDLDAVASSSADDRVLWYANAAGDGTVWVETEISSSADRVFDVFCADVDGDGHTDVLSASSNDDKIAWYRNDAGDGSAWTEVVVSTAADGAMGVSAADLDADGDLDVIAASNADDTIRWFENLQGDGGAWTEHVIATDTLGAYSARPADVDGDGDPDVVTASATDFKVAWHENVLGDGTLWTEHVVSTSARSVLSAVAADVDGDGDQDLLSAEINGCAVELFENTASDGSTWVAQYVSQSTQQPTDVRAADVDGDGDLDVVASFNTDDTLAWHENVAGDGPFWVRSTVGTKVGSCDPVFAADLDGDGDMDVLAGGRSLAEIDWFVDDAGDGSAWSRILVSTEIPLVRSLVSADLDGDGDPDVVSGAYDMHNVTWFDNSAGDGSTWLLETIADARDSTGSVDVGDLDLDGDLDVVAGSVTARIGWYENVGGEAGRWIPHSVSTVPDLSDSVQAVDVDADGTLDVVSAYSNGDSIDLFLNVLGDGSSWSKVPIGSGIDGVRWARAVDLDSDGDLDVVYAAQYADQIGWYRNAAGDATDWEQEVVDPASPSASSVVGTDLDADGDVDLLASSEDDDTVAWYENVAGDGSSFVRRLVSTECGQPLEVFPADIDGDGDTDAVVSSFAGDEVLWIANPLTLFPYGAVRNPAGSLVVLSGTTTLGDTLVLGIDNPLGTQAPGAASILALSLAPDPAFPRGTLLPGFGMAGPGATGELLVGVGPGVLQPLVAGPAWGGPGQPAPVPLAVPADAALVGVDLFAQGLLVDPTAAFGVRFGLTSGLRITLFG